MTLAGEGNGRTRSVYVFVIIVVLPTVVSVVPLWSLMPSMSIAPAITMSQKPARIPKMGLSRNRLLTNMMRKMNSMMMSTTSSTVCNAMGYLKNLLQKEFAKYKNDNETCDKDDDDVLYKIRKRCFIIFFWFIQRLIIWRR